MPRARRFHPGAAAEEPKAEITTIGKNEVIIVMAAGKEITTARMVVHGSIFYADFMTAMMAFFLVMWLVNAAEETKASAAVTSTRSNSLMKSRRPRAWKACR